MERKLQRIGPLFARFPIEPLIKRQRNTHKGIHDELVLRLAQNRLDDEIGTQRNRHGRSDTGFALAGRQIHANTKIDRPPTHYAKGEKTDEPLLKPDRPYIADKREFTELGQKAKKTGESREGKGW